MKPHHLAWAGGKWLARATGTLALWTLWLGLGILLAGQIYIACTNTLEVPRFVQRALEERLAVSGVRATFGRTLFDPSGRILIENAGIWVPGFEEPVVTARAIYARLDPWALAVGRFDPLELRVTGVSLRVPEYLNFRLGEVGIAARGGLHLHHPKSGRASPLPLVDFLAHNYAAFSREFADAIELFGVLDQPAVEVELAPSAAHGGIARVSLMARGLKLAKPELQAAGLRATGEFSFSSPGEPPVTSEVDFAADRLDLAHGATAHQVEGRLYVRLPAGRFKFEPGVFKKIEFTASDFAVAGVAVQSPIVTLASETLPKLQAQVLARVFGSPFSVQSSVDLDARTASARFAGSLSPGLLDPLSLRLKRDIRKYVDLAAPMAVEGAAEFGAGWKFAHGAARVAAKGLTVRGVKIGEARGRVEFDGRRLTASDLWVGLGENVVRGSYEEDMATRDYRFLVAGRLRPLEISPWFLSWWSVFFDKFSFSGAPPFGSADVRSRWGDSRQAAVFLAVDSGGISYRGAPCDRLRGRLFIRPTLTDGLEFQVARGAGSARGRFAIARRYEAGAAAALRSVDFDVASTLDLGPFAAGLGPKMAPVLGQRGLPANRAAKNRFRKFPSRDECCYRNHPRERERHGVDKSGSWPDRWQD